MQTTASTEYLDRTDVARRGSLKTWNELHWDDECCPVGKLDPERIVPSAISRARGPWFSLRRPPPAARRPARDARVKFALSSFFTHSGIAMNLSSP